VDRAVKQKTDEKTLTSGRRVFTSRRTRKVRTNDGTERLVSARGAGEGALRCRCGLVTVLFPDSQKRNSSPALTP